MKAIALTVSTLALLVYAGVAEFMTPEWFPARELIALQAHDSKSYYLKYTFLGAWLVCAALLLAAVAIGWGLARAVVALWRTSQGRPFHDFAAPPDSPDWRAVMPRKRLKYGLLGALLAAPSSAVLGVFVVDFDTLLPLGFGGSFLVIVAAGGYLAGQIMLFDALFLPKSASGVIDALTVRTDAKGRAIGHDLHCGGTKWSVPAKVYAELRQGQSFALLAGHATDRVLELRVRA